MKPIDNYYLQLPEPDRCCLLALKEIILALDKDITHQLKYGMPFFCYKGKMFCYLWVHKIYKQPYLGIVEGNRIEHPQLIAEKRARMRILLLDATKNLPLGTIKSILHQAIELYKTGTIKTPAR